MRPTVSRRAHADIRRYKLTGNLTRADRRQLRKYLAGLLGVPYQSWGCQSSKSLDTEGLKTARIIDTFWRNQIAELLKEPNVQDQS